MPIIPSGGAYPGIINEATLLADAAASVAAAKATAVPDAAAVAAAKAAAVPDAAAVAAAKAAAVPDASAVAAAKATAVPDAATIAALVSPAQSDAAAVAAAKAAAVPDAATIAALVAPAQADAAATAAAAAAANAAYGAIVGVPLRVDAAQSLTEAQKVQGRTNLGAGAMAVASPMINNNRSGLGGWGGFPTFSASPGAFTLGAGQGVPSTAGWAFAPFCVPAGATVTVSFSVTAITGACLLSLHEKSVGAMVSNAMSIDSTGPKSVTLTATAPAAYLTMLSHLYPDSGVSISVAGFTATVSSLAI